MKIVLINTYTGGGAGGACMRLAKALLSVGHEVTVLVAENKSKESFVQQAIGKWRFNCFWALERLCYWRHEARKELRWLFSPAMVGSDISQHPVVQAADIIHLHWVNQGFLGIGHIERLIKLGKPVVWTLHDMWAFTGGCHYAGECTNFKNLCGNCWYINKPKEKDFSGIILRTKFNALYPIHPNLNFVACSAWLRDIALTSKLLNSYPVTNIPNPIDITTFRPQEVSALRNELKLPPDKKLLFFIAANLEDKRKGFAYATTALQQLYQEQYRSQQIELVIVGKAKETDFAQLGYPVHYLGTINGEQQIAKIYAACDVFIMPSLEDNLPNTVMESLACGMPVLAFATGGIPEMVTHQQQGYIAQYKDTRDFANGLKWILDASAEQSQQLRHNCVEKVHSTYTYDIVAHQYAQLYQQLL